MKRYLPLFVFLALALSACTIRFDIGLNINEDESGTFALFVGMDEELRELMETGGGEDVSMTDELVDDAPEGWTVEEVTEDGFEGARISTEFDSIEDLEAKLSEMSEGGDAGMGGTDLLSGFELTHEGDEYSFKADVSGLDDDLTGAIGEGGGDMMSGLDASMMEDLFEIRFRLTLPGSIGEHNADTVNGSELTWNLSMTDERESLHASSTTGGGSSALLIGGVAVAAAAALGVGVAASRRRKTKVEEDAVSNAANPID